MPMKLEEIRGLFIQALKQPHWKQIGDLERAIGDLKASAQGINRLQRLTSNGTSYLERGEPALIYELIWSFIVQGILVPGSDDNNKEWPFLRLTEYGRSCIEAERILPHDPDGYLQEFRQAIPQVDPLITEYLTESLQCFLRDLHRAAAVMLGAAGEQAILLLISSYAHSISDPSRKTQIENQLKKAPSIFRKFDVLDRDLPNLKTKLPKHLVDNIDSLLKGVFDLIRNSRNDAGHPASGSMISRDTNYAHLRLFIPYCQRIYDLMTWFASNQI